MFFFSHGLNREIMGIFNGLNGLFFFISTSNTFFQGDSRFNGVFQLLLPTNYGDYRIFKEQCELN